VAIFRAAASLGVRDLIGVSATDVVLCQQRIEQIRWGQRWPGFTRKRTQTYEDPFNPRNPL
jgi:hypothetical protein